MFQPEQCVF